MDTRRQDQRARPHLSIPDRGSDEFDGAISLEELFAVFRLARILRERAVAEGGWLPLARAINVANGLDPDARHIIDRRTLKKIGTRVTTLAM